jgi:hypothetical protein
LTDVDIAAIVVQVIDALGNCFTNGFGFEIVVVDRFSGLAPTPSCVLEIANQLFLLGIYGDHGPAVAQRELFFCAWMYSNCVLRSGRCAPASRLELTLSE